MAKRWQSKVLKNMTLDFWKKRIGSLHRPRRQRRGIALLTLTLSLIVAAYVMTAAIFAERVAYRDRSAQVTAREISDIANRLNTYMVANVMYWPFTDYFFGSATATHKRFDVHDEPWRSNIDPVYTYDCETGSVAGRDCADSSIEIYPRVEIALHAFRDSRFATPVGVVVVSFVDSDVDEVFRNLVRRYVESNAIGRTLRGIDAAKVYEDGTSLTLDDDDDGDQFAFFAHSFARNGEDYLIRKAYPVARYNTVQELETADTANLKLDGGGTTGRDVNAREIIIKNTTEIGAATPVGGTAVVDAEFLSLNVAQERNRDPATGLEIPGFTADSGELIVSDNTEAEVDAWPTPAGAPSGTEASNIKTTFNSDFIVRSMSFPFGAVDINSLNVKGGINFNTGSPPPIAIDLSQVIIGGALETGFINKNGALTGSKLIANKFQSLDGGLLSKVTLSKKTLADGRVVDPTFEGNIFRFTDTTTPKRIDVNQDSSGSSGGDVSVKKHVLVRSKDDGRSTISPSTIFEVTGAGQMQGDLKVGGTFTASPSSP